VFVALDAVGEHRREVLDVDELEERPLAAAGQPGVEKALGNMRTEIERDMKLMGVTKVSQLTRDMLRFRSIR
jgi:hypothetical protein